MKSPSSMTNGSFHPPKCRGKVQKMGMLYTHSSEMLGPSPNFLITPKKSQRKLKNWKKGGSQEEQPIVCQTTGHGWRATVGHLPVLWLALAHARPTQTSPNFFVSP
jgi:hypothetical protein